LNFLAGEVMPQRYPAVTAATTVTKTRGDEKLSKKIYKVDLPFFRVEWYRYAFKSKLKGYESDLVSSYIDEDDESVSLNKAGEGVVADMAEDYMRMLNWYYLYYHSGLSAVNKLIYYPHAYAPLLTDLKFFCENTEDDELFDVVKANKSHPTLEMYHQQLMIIPPAYNSLAHKNLRKHISPDSEIGYMCPTKIKMENQGAREPWQEKPILPFIDVAVIIEFGNKIMSKNIPEQLTMEKKYIFIDGERKVKKHEREAEERESRPRFHDERESKDLEHEGKRYSRFQDDYKPRERTEFRRREYDDHKPRERTEFRRDDYNPRERTEFRRDDQKPRERTEFHRREYDDRKFVEKERNEYQKKSFQHRQDRPTEFKKPHQRKDTEQKQEVPKKPVHKSVPKETKKIVQKERIEEIITEFTFNDDGEMIEGSAKIEKTTSVKAPLSFGIKKGKIDFTDQEE